MAGEDTCKDHSGHEARIVQGEKDIEVLFERQNDASARLIRVEENTKDIPQIAKDIRLLKEQRAVSKSFIAGMMFVISIIASGVSVAVNAWITRGGHP